MMETFATEPAAKRCSMPWALLAIWGAVNFQQGAWVTIVLPLAIAAVARHPSVRLLGHLASVAEAVGVLAPPFLGWLWDRSRRTVQAARTRFMVLAGGVNLLGIALVAMAASPAPLTAGLLLAALGLAALGTASQAEIPFAVEEATLGQASAWVGVGSLVGNAAGLGVAGFVALQSVYAVMAGTVVLGLPAWYAWSRAPRKHTPAPAPSRPEASRLPSSAFWWLFLARMAVLFGQTLLMTFILYYFATVWRLASPEQAAARLALYALGAAALAAFWVGRRSERRSRLWLVAVSSLPMAGATLAFPWVPGPGWAQGLGVAYGLGYGTFLAVDWALALDLRPARGQVGQTLGAWSVAAGLPAIAAPLFGSMVLKAGPPSLAYPLLFAWAGGLMLLGSALVAAATAPWPRWLRRGLKSAVALILLTFARLQLRVHLRAPLTPPPRGLLILANHSHDFDGVFLPPFLYRRLGLHNLGAVASLRLFEPGFLVRRAPGWLKPLVAPIPLAPILRALDLYPIEDSPRVKPLAVWAWELFTLVGDLPLGEAFPTLSVPEKWRRATLSQAARGRERFLAEPVPLRGIAPPYRQVLWEASKTQWEANAEAIAQALAQGQSLYLTPEGHLTRSGRVERLGSMVQRLLPQARAVWLAAMTYDPAPRGRLHLYCRLVPLPSGEELSTALAAHRLLSPTHWLVASLEGVGPSAARNALWTEARRLLAGGWMHDAHAAWGHAPRQQFERTISALVRRGWLRLPRPGWLEVVRPWKDRRFGHVVDMYDWILAQSQETWAARASLEAAPGAPCQDR
ncbi:MAG: MFS transporter [Firmicutes bacterium]|nr:MFS transporter [Bacillota bacterium]